MSKTIIFITLLLSSFGYCQKQIIVNYNHYYKQAINPNPYEHPATLLILPSESLYEIELVEKEMSRADTYDTELGNVRVIKEKENNFFYKNIKNGTFTNIERIFFKKFTVIDSLNVFKWNLKSETKEILGFKCQKASLDYGGRIYTAYFTNEIPIQNGPWKFYGLPGLILEIFTKNDEMEFHISALSIDLNPKEIKFDNPFSKSKEIISRSNYEELYRNKYIEFGNYRGENGEMLSMSKGKIEIIVKD